MTRVSSMPPMSLSGQAFASEVQLGVRYVLERHVGEGGMGRAYLARREAPEGAVPVVVKVVEPSFGDGTVSAELVAQKEAVALGRLNERVPPCPFVVRFIDTGRASIGGRLAPWIALEYVHGGVEGTTLEDRVTYSIHQTEFAFDPIRATHAIRCLAAGLSAIHGVGVIHRDLTPGNVLCCGFGETEIFKISDFGLARPEGLGRTFAGLGIGTVGYAAPEQSVQGDVAIGPFTDVFAFACVIYYVLTGEHLFEGTSPVDVYGAIKEKGRRSLNASRGLYPDLRARHDAVRALDAAIARATAFDATFRPESADELTASVLPWLGDNLSAPRSSRRLMQTMLGVPPPSDLSGWSWIIRHRPRDDLVIQSAAWDTDGHCFAFTPRGPVFWNGQMFIGAAEKLHELPRGMVFARRAEAGGWLVGGAGGTLALFGSEGVRDVVQAPWPGVEFIDGSGRLDDLVVAVARRGGALELYAMCGRRWLRPLPLEGIQFVTSLARFDDGRFVVAGRLTRGVAFAALYTPTLWQLDPLPLPEIRSVMSTSGNAERELALIVGSEGVVVRLDQNGTLASRVPGAPDLSASALDVFGREWTSSLGTLWTRGPTLGEAWQAAWSESAWGAPFVSLMADSGWVVGLTVDGGIVEGRSVTAPSKKRRG